jgi:hypothetical protein
MTPTRDLGSELLVDRGPVLDAVPEYVGAVHSWTLPGIEHSFDPALGHAVWPRRGPRQKAERPGRDR